MPAVVLVDTNVWVSAFINPRGAPARIRQAFARGEFQVVMSVPLLAEITDVLSRPRICEKYGLNQEEIAAFLRLLAERGLKVVPTGTVHICRDADDDWVLETGLLGQARYMVSRDGDIGRDRDLVNQMGEKGITVLTIQHFLDRLDDGSL